MNYTILSRCRIQSLFIGKNVSVLSCSSSVLKDVRRKERAFSLQSTVETAIKTQHGLFRLISESTPVEYLQNFVINLHDNGGLPWWATIMCTTVLLRSTITTPVAIYQHVIAAKVQNVNVEMMDIAKELRKEVAIAIHLYKWDDMVAKFHFNRSLKKQWNLLIIRDNCHPAKTGILILFQIPLWVCFSVTLRNLVYMLPSRDLKAHLIYSQLTTEGLSWFSNLTQVDHLLIMPVILSLINLTIIEIQSLTRVNEPSRLQRYFVNFFRGFSILMIPLAACVPSGVVLYWTTSSAYGLVQNLILMSPKVKRFCGIPHTALELEKPYSQIYKNLRQRTHFIFSFIK